MICNTWRAITVKCASGSVSVRSSSGGRIVLQASGEVNRDFDNSLELSPFDALELAGELLDLASKNIHQFCPHT